MAFMVKAITKCLSDGRNMLYLMGFDAMGLHNVESIYAKNKKEAKSIILNMYPDAKQIVFYC